MLVVGCSGRPPAEDEPGVSRAQYRRSEPQGNAAAVPFIEATNPPVKPPTARMMIQVQGDREIALVGILYTSDWLTRQGVWQQEPTLPVPWPKSSTVSGPQGLTLKLDTEAPPAWVSAKAFTDIDHQTGEPSAEPDVSFECSRFTQPKCSYAETNDTIRVRGLNTRLLHPGYLAVFCSWSVPPDLRHKGPDSPSQVSASWLFRSEIA